MKLILGKVLLTLSYAGKLGSARDFALLSIKCIISLNLLSTIGDTLLWYKEK